MKLQHLLAVCLLGVSPALAQAPKPPARIQAPAQTQAAVPNAVPATPQQTTATFGDWIVRCVRLAGAPKSCEVAQLVQQDGKPVAQMAFGLAAKAKLLRLLVLVPPSVTFGKDPALVPPALGPADGDRVPLVWQRCLPGGCVAEAEVADAPLARIRAWTAPAHFTYPDATGHMIELPFSSVGLRQALEALAKETDAD